MRDRRGLVFLSAAHRTDPSARSPTRKARPLEDLTPASQKRNSRLTLTMSARVCRFGNRPMTVSRSSLNTTNSSLPGWYSQRNRTFVLARCEIDAYCTSALANIFGVIV